MVSIEKNKELITRFIEDAFNEGNTRLLAEMIAPDHVSHLPSGDHYGPEGVRIDIAGFRAAFPDLRLTVLDLIAEYDRVVFRFVANGTHEGPFMGISPTGRQVNVDGIGIDHVRDGKTFERWVQFDGLGLLRQLGKLDGAAKSTAEV
jgi:predicted ester cyclase